MKKHSTWQKVTHLYNYNEKWSEKHIVHILNEGSDDKFHFKGNMIIILPNVFELSNDDDVASLSI